jgi:hypothetical protein
MSEATPPLPNTPSWRGAQLKHRDNFTFNFNFISLKIISFISFLILIRGRHGRVVNTPAVTREVSSSILDPENLNFCGFP